MAKQKDIYDRKWIIDNSLEIIARYEKGDLTIRALHYQLVSIGMHNTIQHYKRVVSAMIDARWKGLVDFDTFSDHDREMIGTTDYKETVVSDAIEEAKDSIQSWITFYFKNRWENQPYYPEVFIEKKALQGVFQKPCNYHGVALGACKGYPSLTFLNESAERFKRAIKAGKMPVILYFGDYDPSGEDIPRSIEQNLLDLGCEVEVRRFALLKEQVIEWKLPPAPAKETDSRTANWDGLGQVELDAVRPEKLQRLCEEAINSVFDNELYMQLRNTEKDEREIYQATLKDYVLNIEL